MVLHADRVSPASVFSNVLDVAYLNNEDEEDTC